MSPHIDMPYIGLLYAGACNFCKNSCSNSENFRVWQHFVTEFGKGGWGLFSTISLILVIIFHYSCRKSLLYLRHKSLLNL